MGQIDPTLPLWAIYVDWWVRLTSFTYVNNLFTYNYGLVWWCRLVTYKCINSFIYVYGMNSPWANNPCVMLVNIGFCSWFMNAFLYIYMLLSKNYWPSLVRPSFWYRLNRLGQKIIIVFELVILHIPIPTHSHNFKYNLTILARL